MEVDCGNFSVGIAIGDGKSLSSRSGAAVENPLAVADKRCDELRGFILNNAKACSESGGPGDIPALHESGRGEKSTGSEFDSIGVQLSFCCRAAKTDRGHRHRLIVLADAKRRIESIGPGPALNEPRRVGTTGS